MKLDKLLRKNVRVIIPFKEDEQDEFIEIKNPKPYVIKKVKERLINRINGKEKFNDSEILEFLINELTNIELNIGLEELLNQEISFECQMMLYHITDIFHEISQEMIMMMKMELTEKKTKKLENEVALEMSQI